MEHKVVIYTSLRKLPPPRVILPRHEIAQSVPHSTPPLARMPSLVRVALLASF